MRTYFNHDHHYRRSRHCRHCKYHHRHHYHLNQNINYYDEHQLNINSFNIDNNYNIKMS